MNLLRITRRSLLVSAFAALSFAANAQEDVIKIGEVGALSGPFSVSNLGIDYGLKAQIDKINAEGGLLGRKLVLITRDTAGDPAKAISAVRELLFNESVDIIVGPGTSGESLPVMDIVAGAGKLHLAPGQVDELINPSTRPLAFRTLPTTGQVTGVGVSYVVDTLKLMKVAVLADATGYGTLASENVKKHLAEKGVEPVLVELIDPAKADLTQEIIKARDSGAEVLSVWSNATGLLARIINARGDQGWDVPINGHSSLLGSETRKLVTNPDYLKNITAYTYGSTVFGDDGKLQSNTQAFVDAHPEGIEKFSGAGIFPILLGAAEIEILAAAAKKANSIEGTDLAAALKSLGPIQTVLATYEFKEGEHNGFVPSSLATVSPQSAKGYGFTRLAKP